MTPLTDRGREAVARLAQQHGFSTDAVRHMLDAVLQGHGTMAQFNHPEFAGAGQWMRGGMTMVSNLFDHALKARVDALCSALAALIAEGGGALQAAPAPAAGAAPVSFSVPGGTTWWPAELGRPDSTGAQNAVRYAHFGAARRLAIDAGGTVRVYDVGDHRITGFGQQQAGGSSLTFSSQHGVVDIASLPVAWSSDRAAAAPPPPATPAAPPAAGAAPARASEAAAVAPAMPPTPSHQAAVAGPGAGAGTPDVFAAIERLADLHAKGILTAEEFAAKKKELLARV